MENQPQNPEFKNSPENFHTCKYFSSLFETCPFLSFMTVVAAY